MLDDHDLELYRRLGKTDPNFLAVVKHILENRGMCYICQGPCVCPEPLSLIEASYK